MAQELYRENESIKLCKSVNIGEKRLKNNILIKNKFSIFRKIDNNNNKENLL